MSIQSPPKKRAFITGGQRGIGLGIAVSLAKAGFDLVISARTAREDEEVQTALAQLRAFGGAVSYYAHDLNTIDQVDSLLDQVEAECGAITCFVANAGVPAKVRGDLLEVTADAFDFVMDINLRGNFFLAQAMAKRMVGRPDTEAYQSMIFISSVSATMVSIERGEYCLSKAGLAMMTQLFAHRLAPHNIGVFEVRPGIIETGMTAGVKDKYTARIEGGLVPAQRWGQPDDIGATVLPLAQGQMAFATGSIIMADGGLSIPRL